jgi:Myb-like DNA-binding domain
MDPEHEARLKAEARAYALSSTSSKASKRKLPSGNVGATTSTKTLTSATPSNQKPTSLGIHQPQPPPSKVQKTTPSLIVGLPSQHLPIQAPSIGNVFSESDDDYMKFVRSLGLDDSSLFGGSFDNDDEDEFRLSDDEDDDSDDDGDDDTTPVLLSVDVSGSLVHNQATLALSPSLASSPIYLTDFEMDMYKSLEEELGSLLEEDMEAAVHSLIPSKRTTVSSPLQAPTQLSPKTPTMLGGQPLNKCGQPLNKSPANPTTVSPTTPLRETARQGTKTQVTYHQSQQLRRMLTGHYQLLVQQAVLAVRAAHTQKLNKEKSDFLSGETADDLAEILDGAVGMLQDLDENRKDSIRNSIQLSGSRGAKRSLLPKFREDEQESNSVDKDRRLTRAAFTKTLELNSPCNGKRTAFDIPGLMNLKDTFAMIDKSVEGIKGNGNILDSPSHTDSCRMVLRQAAANVDESFLSGVLPLTENFSDGKEIFTADFELPLTEEHETHIRRTKSMFTSGEDNLVLRGVNLYGEKQWILIADRYLPDRSVNSISQRYSKLCLLLYKAHGIDIDKMGNLEKPPKLESVDDIDEEKVKALKLKTVEPPAILNVHRWSLEEDLTLLKAVPLMGHMWAELGARLMPHRDRGHLRKRYQVLERRVKATVARSTRSDSCFLKSRVIGSAIRIDPKSGARRTFSSPSLTPSVAGEIPMTIETAAASLAFLRPPCGEPVPVLKHISNDANKAVPAPKSQGIIPLPQEAAPVLKPRLPTDHTGNALQAKQATNSTAMTSVAHQSGRLPFYTNNNAKNKSDALLQESTSRAAFERLVEGTNDEWSQMSRMKHMLDIEDESHAADAIVTHLAKSPGRRMALSRVDHLDGNSVSGLSILQLEASKQAPSLPESSRYGNESSIMSRVLGNVAKTKTHAPDNGSSFSKLEHVSQRYAEDSPSESRQNRPIMERPSTMSTAPPVTPKRANFFSTAGTPIGLSPGFRGSPGSPRPGLALTPNPMYSPAPNSVMRLMSDRSGDELQFSDFHIDLDTSSRPKLDDLMDPVHDPNPPPFSSPNKNSLNMQEYDAIEAISALNSLSNSPFRAPLPPEKPNEYAKGERKKSLFASVIEGVKDNDTKTKLEF